MTSPPRTVVPPSSPLLFSGTVPAQRALVFDAPSGRWQLRRDVGSVRVIDRPGRPRGVCAPGARPSASASMPGDAGSAGLGVALSREGWQPGRARFGTWPRPGLGHAAGHAGRLVLCALGVVFGLVAGALVDRFGPVVGPAGSGSLPLDAVRDRRDIRAAMPEASPAVRAVDPTDGVAAGADPGDGEAVTTATATATSITPSEAPSSPSAQAPLPVPRFVLSRAGDRAPAPAGARPGGEGRAPKHRSRARRMPTTQEGEEGPILNVVSAREDRASPDVAIHGDATSLQVSTIDRHPDVEEARAAADVHVALRLPNPGQAAERLPPEAGPPSTGPVARPVRRGQAGLDF